MEENKIPVLTTEFQKETERRGVVGYYLKIVCPTCGKSWGVSVRENYISPEQLRCHHCAAKKLEELESQKQI